MALGLRILALTAVLALAYAGPLYSEPRETKCARSCPVESTTAYAPGQTYEYSYVSSVQTSIPGTSEEQSRLHMSATVHLEVLAPCDVAIRGRQRADTIKSALGARRDIKRNRLLSDVSLQDSDPRQYGKRDHVEGAWDFKRALQERSLRFALLNGRVEDVCAEEGEETWVLNIKRAIVSSLQNSMVDFTKTTNTKETDVVGDCEVTYEPIGSEYDGYKVKKVKDVLTCTRRHDATTVFQAMSYQVPSKIQSLPILKSTHTCTQDMKTSGQMKESTCKETHILRPFSKDNSGATTETEFTLTFQRQVSGIQTSQGGIVRRTDLLFEHIPDIEEQTSNRREAMETMRAMCEQTGEGIRPETPQLFSQLVNNMKKLNFEALSSLSSKVPCKKAEKFLRDALPTLSTPASLGVMRDVILSGEISDYQADVWLTSMSFIPKPTREMITMVTALVKSDKPLRKAVLSVSALIHSYCRENTQCARTQEVKQVIKSLEDMIGYDCSGDHDTAMMALKAIGNMGHGEKLVVALNRCMRRESTELRIAAINAFRRMACTAERDEIMSLFLDPREDSEVRINAYLALMACPNYDIIRRVSGVLEKEEINQVGSFIWTHLTNLQETSNVFKQDIRSIVENEELKKEFDLDKRKFSRNIEWSMFNELLNTGAMVESNLIWSTKSFIPRSASVNLTVDIFGQSVNLMEVGGRTEGLDSLLESLLASSDTEERKSNKVNQFDDQFLEGGDNEPKGSYFLRIFGNEIRYDDFHGFDPDSIKDKLNYLQWLIDLANEHSWEYTKSIMFLDTEIRVPTAVGLPLCLSLDGTAIMDMKLRGKLDLRNIAASPRSFDLTGTLRPSAAVTINGEMAVDAFVAKTGLKMVNTFHTSTLADGSLVMKEGKLFNFELNMPNEKTEIFNVDSKFFITYRGEDREQSMITEGRIEQNACLGGPLVNALGVELCGQISFPKLTKSGAPWFPFTGPSSASLVLNKRDSFSKYIFETKLTRQKVRTGIFSHKATMMFNTPGSRIDRELTANFELDRADNAIRVDLRSPWKKMDFDGSIVTDDDIKRLATSVSIDDTNEYTMTAEMKTTTNKFNTKFIPMVQITIPERAPIKFGGSVLYRGGKKAEIDLQLDNLSKQPMTVKGEINRIAKGGQRRFETDLAVRVPYFKGSVTGFVDSQVSKNEMIVSTNTEIKYRSPTKGQEQISHNSRYHIQRADGRMTVSMNGAVATSLWPKWDSDYVLEVTKDTGSMRYSWEGGLSNDKSKRITTTVAGTYDIEGQMKKLGGQGTFRIPYMGWDYEAKLEHEHGPHELKSMANLRYGPNQEIKGDIGLKKESINPLKLTGEAKLQYPGREMTYAQSIEERKPNEYHHDLNIKFDKYDEFSLTSIYKMGQQHELSATVKLPDVSPVTFEGHLKPDLENFKARAMSEYESKSYSVDANWNHKGSRTNFNSKADFELSYPGRQMTLEGDAKRRGNTLSGSIDTKWDAGRNNKKKFSLSAQTTMAASPSFQVKTQWWPNKFVEVSGDFKNDKQGWWSTTRDLEGNLKFLSSFSTYKNIEAAFKHDQTKTTVKSHGELTWNTDKFGGDFNLDWVNGWSNIQADVTLNTPFPGMSTLMGKTKYNLNNGIESTSVVQWEGKSMTMDINGKMEPLQGEITFTSPFNGYEEITLSGIGQTEPMLAELKFTSPIEGFEEIAMSSKYEYDGRKRSAEMTGKWGNHQNAVIRFEMSHNQRDWYISNSGELTIDTPFTTVNRHSLTWQHSNDQRSINSHAELDLSNQKSIFDMEGKFKKNTEFKASINTPYFDDVSLTFDRQGDISDMKTMTGLTWGTQTIQMDNEFSLIKMESILVKSTLTTPWETIILDLNNKFQEGEFLTLNKLQYGSNVFSIQGDIKPDFPSFEGLVKINTPSAEQFELYASNKKQRNIWIVDTSVILGGTTLTEAEFKFGMDRLKKLSADIKTPWEYMKNMKFDLEHRGKWNNFDTKSKVSHNMLGRDILFDAHFDAVDLKDMKAEMNFNSPFKSIRFIKTEMTHKLTDQNDQFDFKLEIPIDTFSISHTLNLGEVYSSKLVSGCSNGNLNWDVTFNPQNGIDLVGSITAPVIGEKSFKVVHEGSISNFKTGVEFVTESGKMNGDAEFRLNDNYISISGNMTCPYSGEQRQYSINLYGEITPSLSQWNNMRGDLTMQMNQHKVTSEAQLTLTDNAIAYRNLIKTPFSYLNDIEITLNHNGPWKNFENDISVAYNGKTISGNSKFKANRNRISGSAEINTPFEVLKTMNVEMEHSGSLDDFSNSAAIDVNGDRMSGETTFKLNPLSASATIRLPEEYSINLKHNGDLMNFNNEATLRLSSGTFKCNTVFKFEENDIEASLTFETPMEGYKKMGVGYKHKGPLSDLTCDLMANIEKQVFLASQHFKLDKNTIDYSFEIEPHYNMYEGIRATFKQEGQWENFKTEVGAEYGELSINGKAAFKTTSKQTSGSLDIETPFESFKNFELSVMNKGKMINFENELIASLNGKVIKASSEFDARNNIAGTLNIETPFRNFKKFDISLNHNGELTNFNNDLTVSLNGKSMSGTSTFNAQDPLNYEMNVNIITPFDVLKNFNFLQKNSGTHSDMTNERSVTYNDQTISFVQTMKKNSDALEFTQHIETPFEKFRTYDMMMKLRGELKDFSSEISASLNGKTISGTAMFSLNDNNMECTLNIDTPFEVFRNFELNVKHTGNKWIKFNNELSASVNGKTLTGSSKFNLQVQKLNCELNIETPFESFKSFEMILKQQGNSWTNFNNEISMSMNGMTMEGSNDFKLNGNNVEYSFVLKSPFSTMKKIELSLTHKGTLKQFDNEFFINLNGQKTTFVSDFSYSASHISGSVNIEYPNSGQITAAFTHNGEMTNFNNEITFNSPTVTFSSHCNHKKVGNKIEGSFGMESSSWWMLPTVEVTYNHQGGLNAFTQDASLTINRDKYIISSEFKNSDSIMGNLEINVPLETLKKIVINFNHEGYTRNFKSDAFVQINKMKYSGNVEFNMEKDIHFAVTTQVPGEYSFTLDHVGPWSDFSNDMTIIYGAKTISSQVSFSSVEKIEATVNINTPFKRFENINARFSHEGTATNFRQESNIEYSGKSITHNLEFSVDGNQLDTTLEISSPCPYLKTFMVKFNHNGRIKNFKNNGMLSWNGNKYKANSNLRLLGKKKSGEITFNIPEEFGIEFIHKGSINDFTNIVKTTLDKKKVNINTSWKKTAAVMDGSFVMRTPFKGFKNLNIGFTHKNKKVMSTTASIKTPFTSFKQIDFELNHEGTLRDFKTSGKLNLPFKTIRSIAFEANHRGRLNNFACNGAFQINDEKFTGDLNFRKTGLKIDTSGSIQTPYEYVNNFAFNLNHDGPITAFTCDGSVELNTKKIEGSLAFKKDVSTEVSGNLKTPFKNIGDVSFNANHQGTLTDFTTNGNAEFNGKMYNGNMSFKKEGNTITSSGHAQGYSFNFNHNGNAQAFTTSTRVSTPKHRDIGLDLTHEGNLKKFSSSAKVTNAPFTQLSSASVSLEHLRNAKNVVVSAGVAYNNKEIKGGGSYKRTDNTHSGSLYLNTPFEAFRDGEYKVEYTHGSPISGQTELTYNGIKHLDIDFTLGTGSNKNANINVNAPRQMSAAVNLATSDPELRGDVNVQVEGKAYNVEFGLKNEEGNKEISLSSDLGDRTISLKTGYELNGEKLSHQSDIRWGNGPNKKLSYNIEVSRSYRGKQLLLDGMFKVTSKMANFQGNFNHKVTPGQRYLSVINIQRLGLRSDIIFKQGNSIQTFFTMQHPSFIRDIVLAVEATMDPRKPSYDGKINLEYANQKFEFAGKIADESSSRSDVKYVAEAHLTHPASDLDVQITSELNNNDKTMGGNMDVKYMMSKTKELKNANLRAEINKLREEMNMEVLSPVKRVSVTGRRTVSDSRHQHFTISGNMGDRTMSAELDINKQDPSFDMTLNYEPEKKYRVYGKYLDPSSLQFEAYREDEDSRNQDSEVSVRLTGIKRITARAFFRPEIISDVKAFFSELYNINSVEWEEFKVDVQREVRLKSAYLQSAISPMVQTYVSMYSSNDLYVRDVSDFCLKYLEIVRNMMYTSWEQGMQHLESKWEELDDNINQIMETYQEYMEIVSNYINIVAEKYDAFSARVHSWFMDKVDEIRQHPRVQSLINRWKTVSVEDFLQPMRDWHVTMRHHASNLADHYSHYTDQAKAIWNQVSSHPASQYVYDYTKHATDNAKWLVEYYELDDSVKAAWEQISETGWETMMEAAKRWIKQTLDYRFIIVKKWEPRSGEFEVVFNLPFQMKDLQSMPNVNAKLMRYMNDVKEAYEKVAPLFRSTGEWCFWDTFYKYKPSSPNPMEWLPPFKTQAVVSGNQHYMTFDKRFYEFAGECSYLLARDFIDGKFSVLVNYEDVKGQMTKKSITVNSDDVEIEILSDFKIMVNGKQTEMPYNSGHTIIRRIGHNLRVDNTNGVSVFCDLYHDRCTVNVTGWYYAKTGGLLGTYDNEPSNDFMKSDRTPVTGVEEFTNSWAVGRRCRAVNRAHETIAIPDSRHYKQCARFFEDNTSPFRMCFKQVDPSAFQTMCINDISREGSTGDFEKPLCDIAAFYVDQCNKAGVPIRMLKDCVKCEMPSGEMVTEGDEVTFSGGEVPQSADVVFVVSHEACNEEAISHLPSIVDQMERNLKAAGLKRNRYAVVGYGGEGLLRTPHAHTVDGELFAAKHKFADFLHNLESRDTSGEDALDAVRFAARYPFRAGVSKSIILVPCEKCREQAVSYGEMQQMLFSRDVRLHVLLQHTFKLRASSPKTSYIFGVDRKGLFTPKQVSDKNLIGDEDLRKQVIMPKDLCAALSEETDGSVFSMSQLLEARSIVQKRFLDVMTRVAAKKAKPTSCQICECVSDENGVGTSVCKNCVAPEPLYRSHMFGEDEMDIEPEFEETETVKPKKPKKLRNLRTTKNRKSRRRQ